MKKYESLDVWKYSEKQVLEEDTNRSFTLTQPKTLFREDYYSVTRAIAVENIQLYSIPVPEFYVYEFKYMTSGCCLCIAVIDEVSAMELINNNLKEFLHGNACRAITEFIEKNGKVD